MKLEHLGNQLNYYPYMLCQMNEFFTVIFKRLEINEGVNELYLIICKNQGLRVPALFEKPQKPQKTIERWIKELRKINKIELRGNSKTGGYYAI